jgi:hypothetical protein
MAKPYKVTPVDFYDTSLAGAAGALEDLLNGLCADDMEITAILPQRLSFSTPDPDSSYRDFHYTETGLLVVARRIVPKGRNK